MAEVAPIEETQVAVADEVQLDVLERKIAGRYMRRVPWGAVAWGLCNCVAFFALFPLVLGEFIPLWLGFILATLSIAASYLPSHEAQHGNIAGRGRPLRWLNELVGHVSVLPLVTPYRVLRATHMEHHAHCNDHELDPDYDVHAESTRAFLLQSLKARVTRDLQGEAYARTLQRIGKGHYALDSVIYEVVWLIVMVSLAWTGYALEAALLWWIPRHLAGIYITYYLSWAPHHPGTRQGRYRDTRAFRSRLGNLVSLGMQYHIVHHLYPKIPLALTPAAYRELRPILERRGCDLGEL